MSNGVTIVPTEFIDARTGEKDFGFRAYDSYGSTYNNMMESIPEDDLEFLKLVIADYGDSALEAMLDYIWGNEQGITIGDHFYDYEEIRDILAEHYAGKDIPLTWTIQRVSNK